MPKKTAKTIISYYVYLFLYWSAYRFLTSFSEPVEELIFKPLLWLAPIFLIVKLIEKKDIFTLGLNLKKPFKKILLGTILSLFIISEYLFALFLKGEPISFNPQKAPASAILLLGISALFTAITEEITFRGYLMTRINKIINNKLIANIISALLFLIIHLPILVFTYGRGVSGILQFFLISGSLGLLDGYVFWRTKGVLAPITSHFLLNFFSVLVG